MKNLQIYNTLHSKEYKYAPWFSEVQYNDYIV